MEPNRLVFLVALTMVAGCASVSTPVYQPVYRPGAVIGAPAAEPVLVCNADAAQFALGLVATGFLIEQARVRAGAVKVRVWTPTVLPTADFEEGRLTVTIDTAGRVSLVRCS